MDKETLDLELEILASWYASEVAKLDLAYAKLKIELLNIYKNTGK